jgi:hypothetical protein
LEQQQAALSVTRADRWRYRSAVHAARVLNSIGRQDAVQVPVAAPRPRRSVENASPRTS